MVYLCANFGLCRTVCSALWPYVRPTRQTHRLQTRVTAWSFLKSGVRSSEAPKTQIFVCKTNSSTLKIYHPECTKPTILRAKIIRFSGEGAQPPPQSSLPPLPLPRWGAGNPLPTPLPLDAYGASILAPAALKLGAYGASFSSPPNFFFT